MNSPGLVVAGAAVIITGDWLETALTAVLLAERTRRLNRLPDSAAHHQLAAALQRAMSASPATDAPKPAAAHTNTRWLTTRAAAEQLGYTMRHTRRIARRLDGDRATGRWLIPQTAILEHVGGQAK